MKRKRFSVEQIAYARAESGTAVTEIRRQMGVPHRGAGNRR